MDKSSRPAFVTTNIPVDARITGTAVVPANVTLPGNVNINGPGTVGLAIPAAVAAGPYATAAAIVGATDPTFPDVYVAIKDKQALAISVNPFELAEPGVRVVRYRYAG